MSNNQLQSKYLDKLVNQTPIGIYKKSELGEAMRFYYYLSPLDIIQFKTKKNQKKIDNILLNDELPTIDQLINNEIGSYLTISLQSINKTNEMKQHQDLYKLPDCSLLYLNENDETNWHSYLGPYLMNNKNLTFEK